VTSLRPKSKDDFSIDMKLTGLGYQHIQTLSQPEELSHQGNTVTYQWNTHLKEVLNNSADS